MEKKTVGPITGLCISLNSSLKSLADDTASLPAALAEKATALNLEITGPQIWAYEGSDGNLNTPFELTIAIPVDRVDGDPGKFRFAAFPEFTCVSAIHRGAWASMGQTYRKLLPGIEREGLMYTGITREIYQVCDFENPENCVTEVQIGVK